MQVNLWSLSPILERATEVIVAAVLVTTKIIGRRMESVTSGTVRDHVLPPSCFATIRRTVKRSVNVTRPLVTCSGTKRRDATEFIVKVLVLRMPGSFQQEICRKFTASAEMDFSFHRRIISVKDQGKQLFQEVL